MLDANEILEADYHRGGVIVHSSKNYFDLFAKSNVNFLFDMPETVIYHDGNQLTNHHHSSETLLPKIRTTPILAILFKISQMFQKEKRRQTEQQGDI